MSGLQPRESESCWVLSHAEHARIFLDGEEYFRSLYEIIPTARKSLYFLGWDFDSRLELVRQDSDPENGYPVQFGPLLKRLAKERPDLEIYILAWDYATYYLPMRELFQKFKFQWRAGPNIHFTFDGQHPLGASHHQKVVVIDDQVAYCGGFDITSKRWDTSEHLAKDPRRQAPGGDLYAPFHDAAVAVSGSAAARLGELARERLQGVMGANAPRNAPSDQSVKQRAFAPEHALSDLSVAISRTIPAFGGRSEIREVEQLYLEQIRAARSYIYIENQYLTADVIIREIERRLLEAAGPQIMIVLPKKQSDPVSRYTMGVLTARAVRRLQKADIHDHCFIGYPEVPNLPDEQYENVHSKVMAVDDEVIRVGSANLNNRSMGLDTECDLTLVAGASAGEKSRFRREVARMIANHFDADAETVRDLWEKEGLQFRPLIDQLKARSARALKEFDVSIDQSSLLAVVADLEIVDLDRAAPLESAGSRLLNSESRTGAGEFFRKVPVGLILTVVSCLLWALVLHQTDWLNMAALGNPVPLAMVLFGLASVSLLAFPAVVALMATLYGYEGLLYLVPGAALAVITGYAAGLVFAGGWRNLPGRWLPLVEEKLSRLDFWSAFWSRFFPFAPFAVVSLICGRLRTDFASYFFGSLAGIAPYLAIVTVFQTELLRWLATSSPIPAAVVVAVSLAVLIGIRMIQRHFVETSLRDVTH